ncbi:MAG: hypothetical protein V5A33_03755 [Halobacteriales archaeon]
MPNRVEKLELRVSELESTVDGLTDELVQAKERIRMLEEHIDGEVPATDDELADPTRPPNENTQEAEPEDIQEATAEADKEGEGDTSDDAPDESEVEDDIIVA